jgi:hypothetical protein
VTRSNSIKSKLHVTTPGRRSKGHVQWNHPQTLSRGPTRTSGPPVSLLEPRRCLPSVHAESARDRCASRLAQAQQRAAAPRGPGPPTCRHARTRASSSSSSWWWAGSSGRGGSTRTAGLVVAHVAATRGALRTCRGPPPGGAHTPSHAVAREAPPAPACFSLLPHFAPRPLYFELICYPMCTRSLQGPDERAINLVSVSR